MILLNLFHVELNNHKVRIQPKCSDLLKVRSRITIRTLFLRKAERMVKERLHNEHNQITHSHTTSTLTQHYYLWPGHQEGSCVPPSPLNDSSLKIRNATLFPAFCLIHVYHAIHH